MPKELECERATGLCKGKDTEQYAGAENSQITEYKISDVFSDLVT